MEETKLKHLKVAQAIKSLLNEIPELKGNVQPIVLPANCIVPYAAYVRIDAKFDEDKDTEADESECTFEVRVYSDEYSSCVRLYEKIIDTFRAYNASGNAEYTFALTSSSEGMQNDLLYQSMFYNIKF